MPPMHMYWSAREGAVTQRLIDYSAARARGGVGLIILEDTSVDSVTPYFPHGIGIWDDKLIQGFKELARSVHSHGAKVAPQLVHRGPESFSSLRGIEPVGPSPIVSKISGQRVRELSVEDIKRVIEQFGEAARRARDSGCDGVSLHAAHSYHLLGSFLSALRNKRTDAYGGSIEGRLKLTLEVIKSIHARAGDDFPIILRISGDDLVPGGRHIEETKYIVPILAEAGISAFNISSGTVPEAIWRTVPPIGTPFGTNVAFAAAVKQMTEVPVIAVGRITDPRLAEHILNRKQADLVAMGRALMADPELPKKAAEGRFEDIAPCSGCWQGCVGHLGADGGSCLINPAAGREREMAITPAKKRRRVMIAGGGPAGLETARVAALRGHAVSLYEKESKLGGQFNLAAVPPSKQELCHQIKYLSIQVEKAGVSVALNTEVTLELVGEVGPDVLVVATGGRPFIPAFPGVTVRNVVTAHDVLAGAVVPMRFKNVVVLGGGAMGCEVADFVVDQSKSPTAGGTAVCIITSRQGVGLDMPLGPRHLLLERLRESGVRIIAFAVVKEILEDGVVITRNGQDETIHGIDCIILAKGASSIDGLSGLIADSGIEVHVIGDARNPRTALEAIRQGAEVARKI